MDDPNEVAVRQMLEAAKAPPVLDATKGASVGLDFARRSAEHSVLRPKIAKLAALDTEEIDDVAGEVCRVLIIPDFWFPYTGDHSDPPRVFVVAFLDAVNRYFREVIDPV